MLRVPGRVTKIPSFYTPALFTPYFSCLPPQPVDAVYGLQERLMRVRGVYVCCVLGESGRAKPSTPHLSTLPSLVD